MTSPLKSQKVLVTGATSGIGLACAELLAAAGADLFLVARRAEKLKIVAERLGAKYLVHDVTAPDFISSLQSAWGLDFDVLINNAGLAIGRDSVVNSNPADWDVMMNVNVHALFRLTHAILPGMLTRQSGDVLNVCSIAGHLTYPGGAVYCAAKHAVWAFTKVLREETCGQNVRVMQISPGMVETEFSVVRFKGDEQQAKNVYQGMLPLTGLDVARQMMFMLEQPRHVCIDEITTMPTAQGSPTTVHRSSR
jgi:3-hydroxy acid dehydrogenase/malonic semialdehyde reductase